MMGPSRRLQVVCGCVLVCAGLVIEGMMYRSEEDSYEDPTRGLRPSTTTAAPASRKRSDVIGRSVGTRRYTEWKKEQEGRNPRASNPPPQEVANCPSRCTCNKTNVACIDTDHDGDVFNQMQPLAYPYLDTVVMKGNRLGDLSSSPLFGEQRRHLLLSLVNLTDNRITSISTDTFIGMPNVEYLYLTNNLITTTTRNTFGALKKLQLLDLRSALKGRATKGQSLQDMFATTDKAPLTQLQKIDLSSNGIKEINEYTFCRLVALTSLELSRNALSSFAIGDGCIMRLKQLDLSGNSFRTLNTSMWDEDISGLDVSENPLECDCALKPFVVLAQREENRFSNQEKTLCVSPSSLAGQSIFKIKPDALCTAGGPSIFSHLFFLSLAIIAIFLVYRLHKGRIPLPPAFQFGTQRWMPFRKERRTETAVYDYHQGERSVSPDEVIFENPLYSYENPTYNFYNH